MTRKLDLGDIQGNILCDYGSSFPKGRYLFLNIPNPAAGRDFIDSVRGKVTTSISWDATEGYPSELMTTKPKVAINIGFHLRRSACAQAAHGDAGRHAV